MRILLALALCSLLSACGTEPEITDDGTLAECGPEGCAADGATRSYANGCNPQSGFSCRALGGIVASAELKPLGGSAGGGVVWKSNNPESFTGDGWLMQNGRTDARRGGAQKLLSGSATVYLYHANKSGSRKYVHLLVTNPQRSAVRVNGEGSLYTNVEKPLNGPASGQSFWVSRDAVANSPRTTFDTTLQPGKAYEIAKAQLGDRNLVDGRFEITSNSGVIVYTVVTSTGLLADALNLSQSTPAPGDIHPPGNGAMGREAGVYAASEWTGTTTLALPPAPAHIGLALNTKEQTSASVMNLADSSARTFGNYGHQYDVTLALKNPARDRSCTVRVSFASSYTAASDTPSFTWNGAAMLLLDGRPAGSNPFVAIYTTPTKPKQALGTWTLAPGQTRTVRLVFTVPGLISMNQQLIVESI